MPEHKKHHYVPQLYLRLFSRNNATLRVFSIKSNCYVSSNASINSQCYKDYFYGKDLKYENALMDLESHVKPIITNIISSNQLPRKRMYNYNNEYATLLLYISLQSARTLFSAEQLNEMTDKFTKYYIKTSYKHIDLPEGVKPEDFDKIKIYLDNAPLINLQQAAQALPFLDDLQCKLIINNSGNEFITSDNPVILYNKYFIDAPFSHSGYACKGLIILFPLSPRHCLIYYDSILYKIGGKRLHTNVIIDNNSDIDEINKLQVINANETLYSLDMSESYLSNLLFLIRQFKKEHIAKFIESNIITHADGKKSQIIGNSKPFIRYNTTASFIKIHKCIPVNYTYGEIARNQKIANLFEDYNKKLESKEFIGSFIEYIGNNNI